jgi:hypothetical protein
MLALLHSTSAHVQVLSSIGTIVFYFHIIAVKACISRCNYNAAAGSMNRSAGGGCIICSRWAFHLF